LFFKKFSGMEQTVQTAEIARAEQMRALENALSEPKIDRWKVLYLIGEMTTGCSCGDPVRTLFEGGWLPIDKIDETTLEEANRFCRSHPHLKFYLSKDGYISMQDSTKDCYQRENEAVRPLLGCCDWKSFFTPRLSKEKFDFLWSLRARKILEKDVNDGCFLAIVADCNYMLRHGYRLTLDQYNELCKTLQQYDDLPRGNEFISLDEFARQTNDFNFDDEALDNGSNELIIDFYKAMEDPLLAEEIVDDFSTEPSEEETDEAFDDEALNNGNNELIIDFYKATEDPLLAEEMVDDFSTEPSKEATDEALAQSYAYFSALEAITTLLK